LIKPVKALEQKVATTMGMLRQLAHRDQDDEEQ